ncbi:MAG: hypothetical protein J7L14_02345, partial [Candidatus Diapherotrites archaeon]|nr:hypothetical protein [Candidatus Diapherotrites archaeon]
KILQSYEQKIINMQERIAKLQAENARILQQNTVALAKLKKDLSEIKEAEQKRSTGLMGINDDSGFFAALLILAIVGVIAVFIAFRGQHELQQDIAESKQQTEESRWPQAKQDKEVEEGQEERRGRRFHLSDLLQKEE